MNIFLSFIKDENPISNLGWTPLNYAAKAVQLNVVKCILEKISDKNPKDNKGQTPLHFVARQGHVQVVWYILMKIPHKKVSISNNKSKSVMCFIDFGLRM